MKEEMKSTSACAWSSILDYLACCPHTSLRPEIIIIIIAFQQVSNVVWVHWIQKKTPLVFCYYYYLGQVKKERTSAWDIKIIMTYPWAHDSIENDPSFFFSIEQRWWHQWNAKYRRKCIQSWMRQAIEIEKEKKKVINLCVCMCLWERERMVTINGRFYMSREDLNLSLSKVEHNLSR
jgi:hypothetical protein